MTRIDSDRPGVTHTDSDLPGWTRICAIVGGGPLTLRTSDLDGLGSSRGDSDLIVGRCLATIAHAAAALGRNDSALLITVTRRALEPDVLCNFSAQVARERERERERERGKERESGGGGFHK